VAAPAKILKEALQLKPAQKAELVDELLSSLDQTDKEIRTLWAREAESRINAYERGKLKAVSIEKVLSKYK
jgi:putative addiction module component (TIGR02574 family)